MTGDGSLVQADTGLVRRCHAVVARLAGLYGWRLDEAGCEALAAALAALYAVEPAPIDRALEQTCCRLRFAALFALLNQAAPGADTAEQVLTELFSVTWYDDTGTTAVRYSGYLFRSALVVLRRRLAGTNLAAGDLEQLAADVAGRALTTVRARFRDCREPDAFWGWLARVVERAAIDELRSGRATGGSSVRALSLDEREETGAGRAAGGQGTALASLGDASLAEARQVDAIAVRGELVRKCRLGKLSIDQREALVRSFWGGEKPAEIAAALAAERGAPVTAAQVSLWKHRGLQVMEANLREHGFG